MTEATTKDTPGSPILLVEDDENDVILLRRAFSQAHVTNRLVVVSDGEAAIAYLSNQAPYEDRVAFPTPILVLLDLKLPRKSGLEVLEWLKEQTSIRRTPVVVLTSSAESRDINRAYDLGANSYLVKPVRFSDLADMVRTLDLYWMILNTRPLIAPSSPTS